jgi:leader peptidase (prepilin peptidase)/N-methyltransferase
VNYNYILYAVVFVISGMIAKSINIISTGLLRDNFKSVGLNYCENCSKKQFKFVDLIPFNFILGKTKCECLNKIRIRYYVVEIIFAIYCTLVVIYFKMSFETIKFFVYGYVLLITAVTDVEDMIIITNINIIGAVAGFIINLIEYYYLRNNANVVNLSSMLIGAAIGFMPLFLLSFTGGFGDGDAWLLGMIGIFIGWKMTLVCLFIAIIIGGVQGIILMIFRHYGRKNEMPFGPAICLAAVVAAFWGQNILNWYLSYIRT